MALVLISAYEGLVNGDSDDTPEEIGDEVCGAYNGTMRMLCYSINDNYADIIYQLENGIDAIQIANGLGVCGGGNSGIACDRCAAPSGWTQANGSALVVGTHIKSNNNGVNGQGDCYIDAGTYKNTYGTFVLSGTCGY
jgi:hypothetical protein